MLTAISTLLGRLRQDRRGATAIEYGLIAAAIAVAIITGVSLVGDALAETFHKIAQALK
ncbi:Flp family type IVb pilin [Elstera cyanobacteriorum]|uniref:Flp family type IVb pilin n=1 Tax=Elstera cyanobacteriorum TaxID=2022747 RepID=UPI0023522689|nr:Flp family type IVb pilin [Elstera cyanobacteriorum]MCK6441597.1 Flp family type IVb pilin [Elstera cyanobacteriorum]